MAEDDTPTEGTQEDHTTELGENGKKALDAERRNAKAAIRERDALVAKLAELEDRDKSELERAIARADAAEKRSADSDARALRLEVASEQGLTPVQAKRLVGTTRDELEADAKELRETFPPPAPVDESAAKVAGSLDLGVRGSSPKQGQSTADQFAAAIKGQFTT